MMTRCVPYFLIIHAKFRSFQNVSCFCFASSPFLTANCPVKRIVRSSHSLPTTSHPLVALTLFTMDKEGFHEVHEPVAEATAEPVDKSYTLYNNIKSSLLALDKQYVLRVSANYSLKVLDYTGFILSIVGAAAAGPKAGVTLSI